MAVLNNLELTKNFYTTTRKLYPDVEICFVSYGSIDETDNYLFNLLLEDKNVRIYVEKDKKTFSDAFNKATQLATKDYVAYLHNDIILTPNFCENILKHCNERSITSYTTIEPPIFEGHSRPGKIIREFGRNITDVNIDELYTYSKEIQSINKDKTETGAVFFMCMPRKVLLEMGGLDNLFNPMFCEDDDLILRFKLRGMELKTSLDAICYHFVSQTSRFGEDYKNSTAKIEYNSNRNFIRKWGFRNSQFRKKYKISYVIKECNPQVLEIIEPWAEHIYVDIDYKDYIEREQKNTKIDLSQKIKNYNDSQIDDIIIKFNASQLKQESYNIIQTMQDIICNTNDIGKFQYNIFEIEIKSLNTYEHLLINKEI